MHEFFDDAERDWLMDNPDKRELSQPDPHKPFTPFAEQEEKHGLHRRDISRDFPDGLQVIFKLANIHLTPEKPRYDGSAWHVEGALNEHICATALFYYDQDNIEASYLEFQHEIDGETMIMKPGQDDYITCEDLYGIAHDGAPVQSIGRVLTRQSRILAFPNVMQHRVQPFSLADPSMSTPPSTTTRTNPSISPSSKTRPPQNPRPLPHRPHHPHPLHLQRATPTACLVGRRGPNHRTLR